MSAPSPAPRSGVRRISQHEALGFAMWLAIHSEMHAGWLVQDVKTRFIPPIAIDQFAVYFSDEKPFGFVTWARLDEAGEASWRNGQTGLRPADWNAGRQVVVHRLHRSVRRGAPNRLGSPPTDAGPTRLEPSERPRRPRRQDQLVETRASGRCTRSYILNSCRHRSLGGT